MKNAIQSILQLFIFSGMILLVNCNTVNEPTKTVSLTEEEKMIYSSEEKRKNWQEIFIFVR